MQELNEANVIKYLKCYNEMDKSLEYLQIGNRCSILEKALYQSCTYWKTGICRCLFISKIKNNWKNEK